MLDRYTTVTCNLKKKIKNSPLHLYKGTLYLYGQMFNFVLETQVYLVLVAWNLILKKTI